MSTAVEGSCKELSLVLLGWHHAGKSSVINTILGSNEVLRTTGQCVKREGDINGKKVTLIDTPGWWNGNSLRDSNELVKLELVRSLSLCPSGPRAILLVVEVNLNVKEKHLDSLEQHVQLLGDKVWDHTIVIFTKWDLLKNMTVDQRIKSGGRAIKKLLGKCGDRYHAFSNNGNHIQITELFQKIEDITRRNLIFEDNTKWLQERQKTLERIKKKAIARQLRVHQERCMIKEKAYVQLKELRVVLLGWVMSGKSSAGNTILNREAFKTGNRTTACERGYGKVAGRKMTILDTAGWWKFFPSELNPDWVKSTFESVSQCKKFPHAILLVLPADTAFKEEQRKIIEDNMAIFGEQIWRHTIVLFTWGDLLGDAMIEQYIEYESEDLQWLIEKCGNRYHVFDNTKRNDQAQVTELLEKIEEMAAENSLYRMNAPDVPETQETKPKVLLDTFAEEMIEEAMEFLILNWSERAVKLREKLEKLMEEEVGSTQFKSNQSLYLPPIFSGEEKSTVVAEVDSKRNFSSKLSDNIKERVMAYLDREWVRQEAIVMKNVDAVLLSWLSDTSSKVSEDKIQASVDKVLWWLPSTEDDKSSNLYSPPIEKKRKST